MERRQAVEPTIGMSVRRFELLYNLSLIIFQGSEQMLSHFVLKFFVAR